MEHKGNEKPLISYFYDALCGWCYGFSPIINQIFDNYNTEFEFNVISGGMITGDRIGPIGQVAPYIKTAFRDVENASGVKFGEAFLVDVLAEGTSVFTSIPAALAMVVFRIAIPDKVVSFASALQRGIYYDGIKPENFEEYGKIAAKFGLDEVEFVANMDKPETRQAAVEDFMLSSKAGITGFPTLVMFINGKAYLLAKGYSSFETVNANIQSCLATAE
ncbi:MAG: DsbA family protein [Bacteroidota bacterium]|nr:DsbA family protein [Bacteroidota bacterium]